MINLDTLNLLINSPINIVNANIITLGNPFLEKTIFKSNLLKPEHKKNLQSLEKEKQIKYLFIEALGAKNIDIIDVSGDEGADYIFDFNKPITDDICEKKYNIFLDLGTSEHIFNRNNVIENIFKLLDVGGIYLFHLPAGGQIDHGFITFSPCFFYDLCFANKGAFSLLHLSLDQPNLKKGISTLPLYQRLDKDYKKIVDANSTSFLGDTCNLKIMTGTSYKLFNYLRGVMLLGAIQKNKDIKINYNPIQYIYRNKTLKDFFPGSSKKVIDFKNLAKDIFIKFPISSIFKLNLLINLSKYF